LNTNIKKLLKTLKLNEEGISMVLGALVIVIVGVLIVNYFKDKDDKTLPEAAQTGTTTQLAEAGKEHTVTQGETLWSIAEDAYGSGYNWVDIKSANNLKSEGLEVGQKLNIPTVTAKKATETNTVVNPTAKPEVVNPTATPVAKETLTPASTTSTSYTVVKGDNLWKIAVKNYNNGYKWVEIAKANKLSHPGVIHPGNVLTLPR
jgi:nucleoid-associated protein YgaU